MIFENFDKYYSNILNRRTCLIGAFLLFTGVSSALTQLDEEVTVNPPQAQTPEPVLVEESGQSPDKPQQSYLALTKLGMGKKSGGKAQGESKDKSVIQVEKSVQGDGKEKHTQIATKLGKKSITEMATATLVKAGLTKI